MDSPPMDPAPADRPAPAVRQRRRRRALRLVAATSVAIVGLAGAAVVGAELDAGPQDQLAVATVAAAPTVTALSPANGPLPGGTVVVASGTGFTTATAFTLVAAGGLTLPVSSATIVSDVRLVLRTPPTTTPGSYALTVTNADGTNTSGALFSYTAPSVSAVTPAWAPPTSARTVTITGGGFSGAAAADVTFNGVAATEVFVVSDASIIARTPTTGTAAGAGRVVVTRNTVASADTAGDDFIFALGVPTVTGLSATGTATSGGAPPGSTLTITGANLHGVTAVFFGNTEVRNSAGAADNVVVDSATSVRVKVPVRPTGTVDVVVQSAVGRSNPTLATGFTYLPVTLPTVSAVQPELLGAGTGSGGGGGVVLITGTNLAGVVASGIVAVCGTERVATAVTVLSNTSLIATLPGNGGVVERCGLRVSNAAGAAAVKVDAISYA